MHLILLLLAFFCPGAPVSAQVVEAVFVRVSQVLELHLGGQVIRTTAEHPFYVVDQGWTAAEELVPGQELVGLGDQAITLNKVVDSQGYETVYNLRVSNHHTYFVGCDEWGFSVWAHNATYGEFVDDLRVRGVLDPDNVPAHRVMIDRGDLRFLHEHSNRALSQGIDPTTWVAHEVRGMTRQLQTDVRLYRDAAIPGVIERADPRLVVDIPFVGQGLPNTNAAGWMRDAGHYWDTMARRYPEAFSDFNRRVLAGEVPGVTSPVNDATFRAVFPQYDVRGMRGDTLIHHHIGGGGQAFAVPETLHPGFGGIHNVERVWGIWGVEDAVAARLQALR